MNRFRTLTADEIECRIAMVKPDKGVSVLLYKTARTDADMLDETIGPEFWENDFKLIDGVLYGGIGVDYDHTGSLVWKWDAGTESNTEAEKGRASDAFKRAGFKHGIGRELYSAPFIWIPAGKLKKLKGTKCFDSFSVASIEYSDTRKIERLIITNQDGEIVFEMKGSQSYEQPAKDKIHYCAKCGNRILPVQRKDGTLVDVDCVLQKSRETFGMELCEGCRREEIRSRAEAKRRERNAEAYANREDGVV